MRERSVITLQDWIPTVVDELTTVSTAMQRASSTLEACGILLSQRLPVCRKSRESF